METPHLQEFHADVPCEPGTQDEVAPPQPPWLLREAEEPLEPVLLHPGRSLLHGSGDEVESRTYSGHQRHAQPGTVLVHPAFLFGCAQTYPDDIRRHRLD